MLFCPSCSNILLTEQTKSDFRFYCKTCPYIYKVEEKLKVTMELKKKEIDDVMGGVEAWENADKTNIKCPKDLCPGTEAYFMTM